MPPDQPPKASPYDFIQQAPYNPPPDHHTRRLVIIVGMIVLVLIIIISVVASLVGSNKTERSTATDTQQVSAQFKDYKDSAGVFKISYPNNFKPLVSVAETEEDTEFADPEETGFSSAKATFYKDGNSDNLNAFGVVVSQAADESADLDAESTAPAASDDFTATLKLYAHDQAVTNVRSAAIKTSGQDGVRTTADFTHEGQKATITLIVASAGGKTVTTWFIAEVSNATFLTQIDPILASFELY